MMMHKIDVFCRVRPIALEKNRICNQTNWMSESAEERCDLKCWRIQLSGLAFWADCLLNNRNARIRNARIRNAGLINFDAELTTPLTSKICTEKE